MYTVYLIENKINGKRYVGCTKYPVRIRFETHCMDAKYHNGGCLLHDDMIKYGFNNFIYKPLIKNIPRDKKQVKMYDKKFNLLKVFSSGVEASKWLVNNNYCNTLQINSSISQSIKNSFKRTTCGFYWSR